MQSDWASEHLQVIRTLMERAAVYRRALAPMMLLTGGIGLLAALGGWLGGVVSPRAFIGYWLAVSVAPGAGSLLLVRRQALKEGEPFWSPPTRRVAQALLPALVAGLVLGLATLTQVWAGQSTALGGLEREVAFVWLPRCWVLLYGCAIHAAGFFMARGIKLFGWVFVLAGCALFATPLAVAPAAPAAHALMGLFFGGLHLAYGIYLYFTESRKPVA